MWGDIAIAFLLAFATAYVITALYCVLYARNKLGINNSDIPVLEKDVMYQLIQTCQPKTILD